MIILDTHIWVWHVEGDAKLPDAYRYCIEKNELTGIGVSAISLWETAKAVELGRLSLTLPVAEWLRGALDYPGIRKIDLTPEIVVESTQLPGTFHKDPSDQLIVATARILNCPLLSRDHKILDYEHVKHVQL